MGKLLYGHTDVVIDLDDRTLAHLQVVIGAKLRRSESFFFTWKKDPVADSKRGSIWLERSIPLYFEFDGTPVTSINRQWLEKLTVSANSGSGMSLLDEPEEELPAPPPAAPSHPRLMRPESRRLPAGGSPSAVGTPTITPAGSAVKSRR